MPDLLLTHGYFLYEDPKEVEIMKPYPPLGLLYLSAYLKRAGFDVQVWDSTFASPADLAARLAAGSGVVGIYTNLITRPAVLAAVAAAKAHGWTVVLGGPESANYPAEYLARGADVVVVGEGEATMAELLPALAARGPHRLHGLPGTVFKDESGAVVTNPEREQIADLDSLPWPDRAAIDTGRYVDVWRQHHGAGSVNLITARGCPYRCRWCSHAVFGFTHRRLSPLDVAAEVEHIRDRWQPDQVWYADDGNDAWLEEFIDHWNGRVAWNAMPENAKARSRGLGWKMYLEVRAQAMDTTRFEDCKLQLPMTVVMGERTTAAAKEMARSLAAVNPQARLEVLERHGHMAPALAFDSVAPSILKHLGQA